MHSPGYKLSLTYPIHKHASISSWACLRVSVSDVVMLQTQHESVHAWEKQDAGLIDLNKTTDNQLCGLKWISLMGFIRSAQFFFLHPGKAVLVTEQTQENQVWIKNSKYPFLFLEQLLPSNLYLAKWGSTFALVSGVHYVCRLILVSRSESRFCWVPHFHVTCSLSLTPPKQSMCYWHF